MVSVVWGGPILRDQSGPLMYKKRSHAAWRSFRFAPERSHAAWHSFFDFRRSYGWYEMASVRASKTSMKPMHVCIFSKRFEKETCARSGRRRTKSSKYNRKTYTLHDRFGHSWAPTWAGSICWRAHLGCSNGAPKNFKNHVN